MSPRAGTPIVSYLCAHRSRSLVAVFMLSFVGAAGVSLVAGPPLPHVHDELSYLLAADTYAHGRLANPAHPFWEHFESPHVIHQPSYASKYQPAQGFILALGQVVSGHALLGLWLAVGLMCASVTWMLQSVLPARWALTGGVLTALQFGIAGAWAQSYWGGAVPAAGAALMFGALARLSKRVTWPPAAALAVGSLVLALSRPFEGFVVFLIVVASLLMVRDGSRGQRARVVLVALGTAAALGGGVMATFNTAVTGNPLTMPYQHHTEQYGAAPLFVFQAAPQTPEYRNERIERFHTEWERREYDEQRSLAGWISGAAMRPVDAAKDLLFGPPRNVEEPPLGAWIPGVLILPLLLIPFLWQRPRSRYALMVVGVLFLALSVVTYFVPHYVSVLTALWMYLVVESLRLYRAFVRAGALRRAVVPLAVCLSVVLVIQAAFDQGFALRSPSLWYVEKDQLQERLAALGGRHLVLVGYSPDYNYHREWVYNSADIDGQDVVWARALGAAADSALIEYYADRTAWSLELRPATSLLEPKTPEGTTGGR